MPKVSLLLTALIVLGLPVFVVQTGSARPLKDVEAAKTLRIIVYRDNPPFSYMEGDEPHGIDVDIGRAIAREMGVEAKTIARMVGEDVGDDLRFNIWRGPFSEGGVGDVMMHIPVDRELMVLNPLAVISNAYYQEDVVLALNPDRVRDPKNFDVFTEHKIGVQYATVAAYFLLRYGDGKLINSVAHYTKIENGIDEFMRGETSAILGPRSEIEGMLNKKGGKAIFVNLPMPGIVRQNWLIGTAVKDDSRDLGYAIGAALRTIRSSGEMDKIFKAHGVTYVAPGENNPLP